MTASHILRKPLFGGPFGSGRFELATQAIVSGGLHAVRFMVIEPSAGRVVSIAESKSDVLATARRVLRTRDDAGELPLWYQPRLWSDAELAAVPPPATPAGPRVSRRRRHVHERSGGRCHYCGSDLKLESSSWHVEHQMPRALGGSDGMPNLVAACATCNLRKGDRTAIEFVWAVGQSRRRWGHRR
ncbi:hypothetical protein CDN99_11715 [Roseateles aquatilis]|uniref:HNH nuclease domain-containing protein n=1 Tax=Roseateles aquatilis TaxID=431061 RepID=A0A246JE02_9BURK|nr:hypothetical protein CDN99_11715 [Roseateles aquatilis]